MADILASIPLNALRVFEAAARLKSFTRAAEELGITQAAVSWQVKALERRLDQALFLRLPREVALTSSGERLSNAATQAMTILRTALTDAACAGAMRDFRFLAVTASSLMTPPLSLRPWRTVHGTPDKYHPGHGYAAWQNYRTLLADVHTPATGSGARAG